MDGYIKIYRSLLNWEWYDDVNTKVVFLHLLLNANWKESKYHGYDVPAGGLVIGLNSLSETLGISVQSLRTALNHLKSTGEITIKSTNKFSVVTIANWEKFQGLSDEGNKQINKQLTNHQQTTNKQLTTEEEYKNIINKEYDIVQNLYNELCPNLNRCKTLTKPRAELISIILETFTMDDIRDVFTKANNNSWLTGGNDKKWKADFDWVMDINNFVRIQEGRYDFQTGKKNNFNEFKQTEYDWDEINKQIGYR